MEIAESSKIQEIMVTVMMMNMTVIKKVTQKVEIVIMNLMILTTVQRKNTLILNKIPPNN